MFGRSTAKTKVLKKFSKITASVRLNVYLSKKLYEEAIADWERLVIKFPRTQVRKVASAFDIKLLAYIEIYENFIETSS